MATDVALAALSNAIKSRIPPAPTPPVKDLPDIPDGLDPGLKKSLDAIRAAVQEFMGNRGDTNNAAVRRADLIQKGFLDSYLNPAPGFGGTAGAPGVAGPPGPPATYTPDSTPPPTVTGLAATAGLVSIIVQWTVASYTQGHGPKQTNIYAAKKAAADATLPTFADAVRVGTAPQALTILDFASDTAIRWHLWAKFESVDGFESASPAGGVNGVVAQTGLVGTSDLGAAIILAANLAPGSVTADKTALDIGGDNLCPNNSFEVDSDADGTADNWLAYNNSGGLEPVTLSRTAGRIAGFAQRVTWTGTNTTTKGVSIASNPARGQFLTGQTYVVSWYGRASSAAAVGMELRWNVIPASQTTLKNPNLSTAWQRYAFRITWGGSVDPSAFLTIATGGALTGWAEFDDVQIEQGDTLTGYSGKLALNTIVAGDGAIGNLAIQNAQIGLLAVDDARISALSASKLTVGDGTVGGNLKSSNYVFNTSGWLVRPDGYAEFGFAAIRGTLLAAQVAANFITASMIAAGQITAAKISVSQLSAITADMGALTAGSVHGGFFHGGGFTNAYAWPASGLTGFHLSSSGLLIGNFNDGKYFQVNANGDVFAPGLSIISGSATFGGTLSAGALVLAGQTLFSPAWSGASNFVQPPNRWTQILSAGPVNPGTTGSVAITVSAAWVAQQSSIVGGEQSADQNINTFPRYRVKRNGTVLTGGTWSPYSSGLAGESCHTLLDTPGGSATYTLEHIIGDETVFLQPPATIGGTAYRTLLLQGATR